MPMFAHGSFRRFSPLLVLGSLLMAGCPSQDGGKVEKEEVIEESGPVVGEGMASFYSDKLEGRKTASGEPYDPKKMTCAHRKLPFGTVLAVERLKNGKVARCTVNDRGPFHEKRIIDVSRAVAEAIDLDGVGKVRLRKVADPD